MQPQEIKEPLFTKPKVQTFILYSLLLTGALVWMSLGYIGYLHLTGRPVLAEVISRNLTPDEFAEAFRKNLAKADK